MTEPEPSMPRQGGDDLTSPRLARWSNSWSVLRRRLSGRDLKDARSAPAPELAYAFLAQRLVHDLPPREGGNIVALSRVCAAPLAADTAMLLALALATESGRGVLIVDGDFQGAGLSRRFGRADAGGLSELLGGTCATPAAFVVETAVAGVTLLPCGDTASLPGALARERAVTVLAGLRAMAGHVLIVQSPLGDDPRNMPLAAAADVVLIVAEEAATRLAEIEQAETMLGVSGIDDAKLLLTRRRAAAGPA